MKPNCTLKTTTKDFNAETKAQICTACQQSDNTICETGREVIENFFTQKNEANASKQKIIDAILEMQQDNETKLEKMVAEDEWRRQAKIEELCVSQEMTEIAEKFVKMQEKCRSINTEKTGQRQQGFF